MARKTLSALEEDKLGRLQADRRMLSSAKTMIFELQNTAHVVDRRRDRQYSKLLADARRAMELADNKLLDRIYRLTGELDERTES